jgi:antitoxin (DNA-binding transcriptional repressor) of toxin-antitoxin stability system
VISVRTVSDIDTQRLYPHDESMGEVIGLGQLRSDACTYLERVARGETLEVVRRGRLYWARLRSQASMARSGSMTCELALGAISIGSLRARRLRLRGAVGWSPGLWQWQTPIKLLLDLSRSLHTTLVGGLVLPSYEPAVGTTSDASQRARPSRWPVAVLWWLALLRLRRNP